MKKLVLAFDIGTSSLRTSLFDESGRRIVASTAQKSYPLLTNAEGMAELDPTTLLKTAHSCLTQTLLYKRQNAALKKSPILAVGGSCFWHSMIGIDLKRRPTTRIITWADTRCRHDAELLRKEFDEKAVHARTGTMLRSSFWVAKLAWLKRTQPTLLKRTAAWMSPSEWLFMKLFGKAQNSLSMASGTGLLNVDSLEWDRELLSRVGLREERLDFWSDDSFEPIIKANSDYPELQGVPIFPAIGDGAASNLGSGAIQAGFAAINVGTSAAVRLVVTKKNFKTSFGLFRYRVDENRSLVGGAVSNAGNLRQWCLRELNLPDDSTSIEKALSKRFLPDHGLTVLPFWVGERAPTWNDQLGGTIVGLHASTSALDILQATTEAVYHRIAWIADLLPEKNPQFIVSGGIQNSKGSLQRLSNVMGRTLVPSPENEASIRGAAIFALERLGKKIAPLPRNRHIRPDLKISRVFSEKRKKQISLEEALSSRR